MTPDGGLRKRVLCAAAAGAARPDALNSVVDVTYEGRLPDGTVFDSTEEDGTVFSFQVGAGKVIRGW